LNVWKTNPSLRARRSARRPGDRRLIDPQLRRLYPGLSDEELLQVQETFDLYLDHAVRMYERIRLDPVEHAKLRKLVEERRARETKEREGDKLSGQLRLAL